MFLNYSYLKVFAGETVIKVSIFLYCQKLCVVDLIKIVAIIILCQILIDYKYHKYAKTLEKMLEVATTTPKKKNCYLCINFFVELIRFK